MMLTGLRQILKDYMSPSDLDSFANMVVNIGHDRLFRNMMDFIRYFQFEGCLFLLNTHTDNFLNLYIYHILTSIFTVILVLELCGDWLFCLY